MKTLKRQPLYLETRRLIDKLKYEVRPVAKVLTAELVEDTREYAIKVRAHYQGAKWWYLHPEVMGHAKTEVNTVGFDPFVTNAKDYHRSLESESAWSWADAPDVILVTPEEVKTATIGKYLATLS